jgi:hypothetical protein
MPLMELPRRMTVVRLNDARIDCLQRNRARRGRDGIAGSLR